MKFYFESGQTSLSESLTSFVDFGGPVPSQSETEI